MDENLEIVSEKSALLLLDFHERNASGVDRSGELIERTAVLLDAARRAGLLIIYVIVGFRPGCPEISPRNMGFMRYKAAGMFDSSSGIHPALAPRADEPVVTKHRVSAFHGTDLEMLLRARGVDTLIFTGILTSGVVLSTLRHAADADYRLFVAEDCCADNDADVHRILTEKVFPRQAIVASAADIAGAIMGAPSS